MTTKRRNQEIVLAVLGALDNLEGDPCSEPVLFASLKLLVPAPLLLSEFDSALRHCEAQRWVLGLRPELGTTKWSLTDKGKALWLESQ